MMGNHYKCTDGTRVSKAQIDKNVRKAKALALARQLDEYGHNFCMECRMNDCKPLDCSHRISVDECQKRGTCELAWDIDNIRILGRKCHQEYDKLNLKFNNNH